MEDLNLINMLVINKTNEISAENILVKNGFKIISNWYNDNIFERDGIKYGINHPVWNGNNINIYKKDL